MNDNALLGETIEDAVPLQSLNRQALMHDDLAAHYDNPKINFSNGWKGRAFIVIFWLYIGAFSSISLSLGLPTMNSLINLIKRDEHIINWDRPYFKSAMKILVYIVIAAPLASGVVSFVTYFLLQIYVGRIIKCTFIIVILLEIVQCVIALLIPAHWIVWVISIGILLITLVYVYCVRKQIPFAEVHLKIVCAILRKHPSLILVTFVMVMAELFLFICFCLMLVSVLYGFFNRFPQFNTMDHSFSDKQPAYFYIFLTIITVVPIVLWYLVAGTFFNVARFIIACIVGRWWFGDNADQQYRIGTSIKRAFTTNFGIIYIGRSSQVFLEGKSLSLEEIRASNIQFWTIIAMQKWRFAYEALTGRSYTQSVRNIISSFEKRRVAIVARDIRILSCFVLIYWMMAITSAVLGGLIVYHFVQNLSKSEIIMNISIAVLISFLMGSLCSLILLRILYNCVRTIFLCFALSPAALNETHPEHLQDLVTVWYKFHRTKCAIGDHTDYSLVPNTTDNV